MMRLLTILMVLLLSGCVSVSSTPTRYYQLQPLSPEAPRYASDLNLLVGPLFLPDYLKRQALVSRISDTELSIEGNALWAGALEQELPLLMATNLSALTGSQQIFPAFTIQPQSPTPQLLIVVDRFDAQPGGQAQLSGYWELHHQGMPVRTKFSFQRPAPDTTDDIVAVMSQLVADLAAEIATSLTNPASH